MAPESQDIESATVQISPIHETIPLPGQPDSKTRRYDRQLRLWASSGQTALESSHILVISATPTNASTLKNLVLPGIGAFTLLDDSIVEGKDVGANFFLELDSIGKNKAIESTRLLLELNESVQGYPETRSLEAILNDDPTYLSKFSLVIAHNLRQSTLERVSSLLWEPPYEGGTPGRPALIVVRTAGFLADFSIQLKEHPIITTHSESTPTLRIDKPFPSLLAHAFSLNFETMDVTDHAHVPYVVILVKVLQEWKNDHAGNPPKTYAEKQEFKRRILKMKKKDDEENFDEAYAQAYRAWTPSVVPKEIEALFSDPSTTNLTADSDPFFHLVHALSIFVSQPPHTLPLSASLPDMKSDTKQYIQLQKIYKQQAEDDKAKFKEVLRGIEAGSAGAGGGEGSELALEMVDEFAKNSHALRLIKGKRWGDESNEAIVAATTSAPNALATHLALSSLFSFEAKNGRFPTPNAAQDKAELLSWAVERLKSAGWEEPVDEEMPSATEEDDDYKPPKELTLMEHLNNAIGEIARAPTAELPTTSALIGGMVAQEAIKVITKQYVPVEGLCAVDTISSITGALKL